MTIVPAALTLLAVVLAAGCALPAAAPPADSGVIRAIVTHIDADHGYLVVEWSAGRTLISMDPRALGYYRIGDAVALDSALRPLPRR